MSRSALITAEFHREARVSHVNCCQNCQNCNFEAKKYTFCTMQLLCHCTNAFPQSFPAFLNRFYPALPRTASCFANFRPFSRYQNLHPKYQHCLQVVTAVVRKNRPVLKTCLNTFIDLSAFQRAHRGVQKSCSHCGLTS